MDAQQKKSFFKRFWWIGFLGIAAIAVVVIVMNGSKFSSNSEAINKKEITEKQTTKSNNTLQSTINKPCPANLSGILTYPFMESKYIAALTPLGNINPPGHTSPVDHVYFATTYEGRIPLYAPADAVITSILIDSVQDDQGTYTPTGYVISYTVCDGVVLDFAAYTDVIQPIKDAIANLSPSCTYGIEKSEHEKAGGQCGYQLSYPVTAGQEIGWVQAIKRSEGELNLPFEIWAANYNEPAPSQTNWEYYNDDRYAHIICLFDLYTGDLKKQYEQKFGRWETGDYKDPFTGTITPNPSGGMFIPRTVEPLCGQVDQDVTDTIQGMWFSQKPDNNDKSGNIAGTGQGLAIVHDNLNPTLGVVSIGGELTGALDGSFLFVPEHEGTVNREPSEVTADGKVYCYDTRSKSWGDQSTAGQKILVQLIDSHHLIAENKSGSCLAEEIISTPYQFER